MTTAEVRSLLAGLMQRIDDRQLDKDDLFTLSMIAMVAKKQNLQHTDAPDDSDAFRYLTVGWLVDGMLRSRQETGENDN